MYYSRFSRRPGLHKYAATDFKDELTQLLDLMTPQQREAYERLSRTGLGKYTAPAKRTAVLGSIPGAILGGAFGGLVLPEMLKKKVTDRPGWLSRVLGGLAGAAGGGLAGAGLGALSGAAHNWALGLDHTRTEKNLEIAKQILNGSLNKTASAESELHRALSAMTPEQRKLYERKARTEGGEYLRTAGRAALTDSVLGALLGGTVTGILSKGDIKKILLGAGAGGGIGGVLGAGGGMLNRYLYKPEATLESYNTKLARGIASKPFSGSLKSARTGKYMSELDQILDQMSPDELARYKKESRGGFGHHTQNIGRQTITGGILGGLSGGLTGGPAGAFGGTVGGAARGAVFGPLSSYLLATEQTPREYNLALARKILNG